MLFANFNNLFWREDHGAMICGGQSYFTDSTYIICAREKPYFMLIRYCKAR